MLLPSLSLISTFGAYLDCPSLNIRYNSSWSSLPSIEPCGQQFMLSSFASSVSPNPFQADPGSKDSRHWVDQTRCQNVGDLFLLKAFHFNTGIASLHDLWQGTFIWLLVTIDQISSRYIRHYYKGQNLSLLKMKIDLGKNTQHAPKTEPLKTHNEKTTHWHISHVDFSPSTIFWWVTKINFTILEGHVAIYLLIYTMDTFLGWIILTTRYISL